MEHKKIKSFIFSVLLALGFTSGFALQYVEQMLSQSFFVNWKLRDHPFPSELLMRPTEVFEVMKNYEWPLLFLFTFLGILVYLYLNSFSKQIIIVTILMFLFSTNVLPWNQLRETFLAVLQFTGRFNYLLPVFIIIALAISAPRVILLLCMILQIGYYLISFPLSFQKDTPLYPEYGFQYTVAEFIEEFNSDANTGYRNPFQDSRFDTFGIYGTSGDEYLTIDVNHENIRNGKIREFEYNSDEIRVSNVKNGYNSLEFDVDALDSNKNVKLVLPRIWYKGYVAEYSQGAKGSQPKLDYGPKSSEEIKADRASGKSTSDKKVLHDGRAVIHINKSGHVKIEYRKTLIQWIGYIIEFISFVIVSIYGLVNLNSRKNKAKK